MFGSTKAVTFGVQYDEDKMVVVPPSRLLVRPK
jgi:hypothetical protein